MPPLPSALPAPHGVDVFERLGGGFFFAVTFFALDLAAME